MATYTNQSKSSTSFTNVERGSAKTVGEHTFDDSLIGGGTVGGTTFDETEEGNQFGTYTFDDTLSVLRTSWSNLTKN